MLSPLEEIKNKLDIVEVIGQYVKLEKAGSNYKALCPFHKEKTPSFFVSPSRQIWHCFGCGAGGDIFTFIMKIENVDFPEAVRILAEKAGVKLTYESPEIRSQKQRLIEIHQKATSFFHQNLLRNSEALDYLHKRGLTKDVIEEFELGYAPDEWRATVNFLVRNNFTPEEILASGLAISKKDIPATGNKLRKIKYEIRDIYDRFRARIIFPIRNNRGKIVAFTGRIFQGSSPLKTIRDIERVGKYINSPQTLIFDKSKILFGYYKSRLQLSKTPPIVVEGPMDFLAGWQAGLRSIVATCGTALTPYHISILKRFNQEIILGFDMDEAGLRAAERAINLALSKGLQVKILMLPEGKDLADYLLSPESRSDIKELVSKAKPIMEFYWERAIKLGDSDSLEGKKKISAYFLPKIKKLPNALDRAFWSEKLSHYLKIETSIIEDELNKIEVNSKKVVTDANEGLIETNIPTQSREIVLQERILAICSHNLEFVDQLEKYKEYFSSEYQQIIQILQGIKDISELSYKSLQKSGLAEEIRKKINLIVLRGDYELDLLDKYEVDWRKELESNLQELKRIAIKKQLNILSDKIKKAEEEKQKDKLKQLLKEFNNLSKKLIS